MLIRRRETPQVSYMLSALIYIERSSFGPVNFLKQIFVSKTAALLFNWHCQSAGARTLCWLLVLCTPRATRREFFPPGIVRNSNHGAQNKKKNCSRLHIVHSVCYYRSAVPGGDSFSSNFLPRRSDSGRVLRDVVI